MIKSFAESLRDLINSYYAAGVSQDEIVKALACAEDPEKIEFAKTAKQALGGNDSAPTNQILTVTTDPTPDAVVVTNPLDAVPESVHITDDKEVLLGSTTQPASFEMQDGVVELDEVVKAAFKSSGIGTAALWNSLPEVDREKYIADMVATIPLKKAE